MKTLTPPRLVLVLLALGLTLCSGCAYVSSDPHGKVARLGSYDEMFPAKVMGFGPHQVPTPSLTASSTTTPPSTPSAK